MARRNDRAGVMVWRKVHLTDRSIRKLAEHALTLPVGHPARAIITLLVERWSDGEEHVFADEPGRRAAA